MTSRQALRRQSRVSALRQWTCRLTVLGGLAFGAAMSACGGSPIAPPPPPPPVNKLPTITSIKIQGSRINQPASFADVGEVVNVTADVQDDETPVNQLQLLWSASVGTFSGSGRVVTWQAPSAASAPVTVTLQLEVVERYGPASAPTSVEHRVTSSAPVKLHDSIREVGEMARQFLLDFSDTNIRDVSYVMRHFEPGCYGTDAERIDVEDQRRDYRMVAFSVGAAAVSVRFGGVCPYLARPGDACAQVPVVWDSIRIRDGAHGPPARGTDQLAAIYVPARDEWRLCDSQFNGVLPFHMRGFTR
jgi:hypothetical protein